MSFSYDDYLSVHYYTPIRSILFYLVLLIIFSYGIFRAFRTGTHSSDFFGQMLAAFIEIVFLSTLLIRTISLIPSGVQLLRDKNVDPISAEGCIELIKHHPIRPGEKYSYEGETTWGVDIMIDGVTYKAVTNGRFEVGDRVAFQYLPNSHFILTIQNEMGQTNY